MVVTNRVLNNFRIYCQLSDKFHFTEKNGTIVKNNFIIIAIQCMATTPVCKICNKIQVPMGQGSTVWTQHSHRIPMHTLLSFDELRRLYTTQTFCQNFHGQRRFTWYLSPCSMVNSNELTHICLSLDR